MALSIRDPLSYANSEDYLTTHLHIDWSVDFDYRVIEGSVTLTLRNITKNNAELKLDSRNLNVKEVMVQGREVQYTLTRGSADALGCCLSIPIDSLCDELTVRIKYGTTKDSLALQWLDPEQTCGKMYPYLFSQCEAIHARSLFPCQDTPSVKATYSAKVRARADLNVLMSAVKDREVVTELGNHVHKFEQKIPIPSYLIVLVCGNIKGKKIGPRSTVWSEPEMIDMAAREFEDTEEFIRTGEELCGPYVWGVYDILVLPPSFPFGGMENPCLTYVTPTLLVGDKSLVFVIAHEISHSWTGNLITNETWEDFWLNEGHTRYVERLILERYYGNSEGMRHFLIEIGIACLQESLNDFGEGHPYNQMVPTLVGVDPDEAFSRVPYEKGSNLLFYLESVCGKDKMLRWLKAYLDKFKNRSLSTKQWKEFLYHYMTTVEHVEKVTLDKVEWDKWFYGRWKIPVEHSFNREFGIKCETLVDAWKRSADSNTLLQGYEAMVPCQKYYFQQILNDLLEISFPHDKLELMGHLYGYTSSTNSEILFGWARLAIRSRYEPALDQIFRFLNSQGRGAYTMPIYKALYAWPEQRQRTVDFFQINRKKLHPITSERVRIALHLSE